MSDTGPCYRHPQRETGVHCTRCGNRICPDCMIVADVGHHCPSCVRAAQADTRRIRHVSWRGGGIRGTSVVVVRLLVLANVVFFAIFHDNAGIVSKFANSETAVAAGEYYRLLSSAFLHANLAHLLVNLVSLVITGSELEPVLGKARFLVLYLLAAVGGSVCSFLIGTPFSVGASGALFGVLGALLAIARHRRMDTGQIIVIIAVNLLIGALLPRVDNAAHVGGLVTGGILGAGFEWSDRRRHQRLREVAVSLTTAAALVGLVLVPPPPTFAS